MKPFMTEIQCKLQIDAMFQKDSLRQLQNRFLFQIGLQIVYTTDEVNFIQNLVFYIQCSYRTPVSKQLVFLELTIFCIETQNQSKGCQ